MAKMWPNDLPDHVLKDPSRSAERDVYGKLRSELDDGWEIYYSRPWRGVTESGEEIDGEADFILAHPVMGVLVLEVKGGGITYDPSKDLWTSRDRNGEVHPVKDPFKQAVTCKRKLIDKLRKEPGWPGFRVTFRHGVVFPDCRGVQEALGWGAENEMICYNEQMVKGLSAWIFGRLGSPDSDRGPMEKGPGKDGLAVMRKILAVPVALTVPLLVQIRDENAGFEKLLTGPQMFVINSLEDIKRLLVEGGAGTGKTVVAAEIASRGANNGKRVLAICFNLLLSSYLTTLFKDNPNVDAFSFHQLCESMLEKVSVEIPKLQPNEHDYYETVLPREALAAAGSGKIPAWDIIIVDEAQDIRPHWWELINRLADRSAETQLAVFFDPNQFLYPDAKGFDASSFTRIPLKTNLRNTLKIAEYFEGYYNGKALVNYGPEGVPPKTADVKGTTLAVSGVKTLVLELREKEKIPLSEIVILVPSLAMVKDLKEQLVSYFPVKNGVYRDNSDAVLIETVRRFKGLESAFVIVVTDKKTRESNELMYVACSRARSRLFVFNITDKADKMW